MSLDLLFFSFFFFVAGGNLFQLFASKNILLNAGIRN